jgi:predicted nucleotide-binding protein (sugar kinase/HSP70/actin superfamily)
MQGLIVPGPPLDKAVGTYPSIGVMTEMFEGFAQTVGIGPNVLVLPPPNTAQTLNLGTRYAPEGACLPFKLIMGNLMQTLGSGANTVGMMTERGPCRMGMFSLAMRLIFSDLNLGNGWLEFNNASLRKGYIRFFRENYRKTCGHDVSLARMLKAFLLGLCRLSAVEALEAERNRVMAYELEPGSVLRCFEAGKQRIRECRGPLETLWALRRAKQALRAVPADPRRDPVHVVVTGEIFCVVDPFANLNIEARLARLGAVPRRLVWQTGHVRHFLHLDLFEKDGRRAAVRASRRYVAEYLDNCSANVGHALLAHRRGDDGMVHLKPFGCMVEFSAENLLQVVQRDTGFPILSLTLDDLTGEERVNVRLEAFIDNLRRRRHDRRAKKAGRP